MAGPLHRADLSGASLMETMYTVLYNYPILRLNNIVNYVSEKLCALNSSFLFTATQAHRSYCYLLQHDTDDIAANKDQYIPKSSSLDFSSLLSFCFL